MTLRETSPHAASVVMSAVIDLGDGRLEVALEHAVELEALPGGHPQGAVGPAVGHLLEREVLVGIERPRRERHPHHERERLLRALVPPLARVAVVLLVGAVELEQGDVVAFEMAAAVVQLLRDGSAEMPPLALGGLDFGFLGHGLSVGRRQGVVRLTVAALPPHADLCRPAI